MKTQKSFRSLFVAGALCAASLLPALAGEEAGYVDFGKFTPKGGGQFVEVNIGSNLISMVTALTKKDEPEVAEMLAGLKQVRVNVLGLNDENREEIQKRVGEIRAGLDKQGWERIVTAIQEDQDVGVYLKTKDTQTVAGLVVTVIQKNEQAVLINIIGDIKPEKLAEIGERFNVEPLKHLPGRPAKDASKS